MSSRKLSEVFRENDCGDNIDREEDMENKRIEDEAKELFNEYLKMEPYYKALVDEFLSSTSTEKIVVVLISFSAIGVNELNGQLLPGEMALSAFSLESGIIDNCSVFINHGNKVPERALQSLSNLLELPTQKGPEDNYGGCIWKMNLFRKKHRFGKGKNEHALLFCRKYEYDRVTSCLDFLFGATRKDPFGYQIFPLEYLVSLICRDISIKKGLTENRSFDREVVDLLESSEYNDMKRMGCTHHYKTQKGLYYCPLRTVNIQAYNIIGALVDTSIATVGIHFPSDTEDDEVNKRQNQLLAWDTDVQQSVSVLIPENYEPEEIRISSASHCLDTGVGKSTNQEAIPVAGSSMVSCNPPTHTFTPQLDPSPPQNLPPNLFHGLHPKTLAFLPGFVLFPSLVPVRPLLLPIPTIPGTGPSVYLGNRPILPFRTMPGNYDISNLHQQTNMPTVPMCSTLENGNPQMIPVTNVPIPIQPQSIPFANDQTVPNTKFHDNNQALPNQMQIPTITIEGPSTQQIQSTSSSEM